MDRSLDDVVRERPGRNITNGTYDESRLWVHDKFDGGSNEVPRRAAFRDTLVAGRLPTHGAKLKVENIHYELGEDELLDLFRRQGPVNKLDILYDRAGRSEGTAFVTYAHEEDAISAIKEYNGANANGQPITLTLVAHAVATIAPIHIQSRPRSLFDRITPPDADAAPSRERRRSADDRRDPTRKPTPPGIDRYVPPERRRERDRERTQSGPRPAGGRDNGGRGRRSGRGEGGGRAAASGGPRPKKTVEELDAEMNDYFDSAEQEANDVPQSTNANAALAMNEDEDMIL